MDLVLGHVCKSRAISVAQKNCDTTFGFASLNTESFSLNDVHVLPWDSLKHIRGKLLTCWQCFLGVQGGQSCQSLAVLACTEWEMNFPWTSLLYPCSPPSIHSSRVILVLKDRRNPEILARRHMSQTGRRRGQGSILLLEEATFA